MMLLIGFHSPGLHRGFGGSRGESPVNEHELTCHISGSLRCEKDNGPVKIHRVPDSSERDSVDDIFHPLHVLVENCSLLCFEPSRRETVDRYLMWPQLVGKGFRHLEDPPRLAQYGTIPA